MGSMQSISAPHYLKLQQELADDQRCPVWWCHGVEACHPCATSGAGVGSRSGAAVGARRAASDRTTT